MLIELVKSKPGLYDLQTSQYSDAHFKKQAWNEIGKTIGQSGAKTRWECLRGQYRKYLAKLKTKSGQAAAKITKWRFADHMEFLTTYINVERPRLLSRGKFTGF
ncbi:uncharacterized protein LOC123988584 isoform X2 [Osmia bicornis bicornis]|nr:uncharacterized protein LOC123988584 isoform X2 [Osmia bicornis bicornis]